MPATAFALGILLIEGQYLLQLRDDRADIADPGVWALFGGRIEQGETPEGAFRREMREELGLDIQDARFLWCMEETGGQAGGEHQYWIFEAELGLRWLEADLGEGQSMGRFTALDCGRLPMAPLARRFLDRHRAERESALQAGCL